MSHAPDSQLHAMRMERRGGDGARFGGCEEGRVRADGVDGGAGHGVHGEGVGVCAAVWGEGGVSYGWMGGWVVWFRKGTNLGFRGKNSRSENRRVLMHTQRSQRIIPRGAHLPHGVVFPNIPQLDFSVPGP